MIFAGLRPSYLSHVAVQAGLFSATVTAFAVESYQWLQEDPTETLARLQLANLLNDRPPFAKPTPQETSFVVTPSSIRVNVLWFTSLTLALASVLVGILCKQWLREYQRYENLTAKQAFPVRQMRYEGLVGWRVPAIISFIPLLLQAALILFFAGLLDLLWSLQHVVASVVTVTIGMTLLFLIVTSALSCLEPLLYSFKTLREHYLQCPYKSPQSWAFHHLSLRSLYTTWIEYDLRWVVEDVDLVDPMLYTQQGFAWLHRKFAQNINVIYDIYRCFESLDVEVAGGSLSRILRENPEWDDVLDPVQVLATTFKPWRFTISAPDHKSRDAILSTFAAIHHEANDHLYLRCLEHCTRLLHPSTEPEIISMALKVLKQALESSRSLTAHGQSPYSFLVSSRPSSGPSLLSPRY